MLHELLEAPLTFNPVNHPNVLRHTNVVLTTATGDDLPENQDVAQTTLITMIYAGFTHRSAPNMRLLYGNSHRSASRFRNFYEVANTPQWRVYQVLTLANVKDDMGVVSIKIMIKVKRRE